MKKVHWYYKFLIIFILFFSMFFLLSKNMSNIVNSSLYKNYMNFVSVPFNFLNKYNVFNYKDVLKKNAYLEKHYVIIKNEQDENKYLHTELEKLKDLLELKDLYSDYDKVFAKTISRNKMYWFNTAVIDKGRSDGIKENNLVLTSDGLVGVISSTTKDTSTIKLITNNDNDSKISVGIKTSEGFRYGVISGYEKPYLKIELTSSSKNIKEGDTLVTSGLGNLPYGIEIGKVHSIKKDSYELVNLLYVTPSNDMEDINYVMVLAK